MGHPELGKERNGPGCPEQLFSPKVMSDSLRPHGQYVDHQSPLSMDFLLQGIFPTQGLNPRDSISTQGLSLLHLLHLAGRFFTIPLPGKSYIHIYI